jgi:hypothetical protein
MCRDVVEVDAFEREAGFAPGVVMAFEAVATNDALVASRELLVGPLAAGHERGGEQQCWDQSSAFH